MFRIAAGQGQQKGERLRELRKLSDVTTEALRAASVISGTINILKIGNHPPEDKQIKDVLEAANVTLPKKIEAFKHSLEHGSSTNGPVALPSPWSTAQHRAWFVEKMETAARGLQQCATQLEYLWETGEPMGAATIKHLSFESNGYTSEFNEVVSFFEKISHNLAIGMAIDYGVKTLPIMKSMPSIKMEPTNPMVPVPEEKKDDGSLTPDKVEKIRKDWHDSLKDIQVTKKKDPEGEKGEKAEKKPGLIIHVKDEEGTEITFEQGESITKERILQKMLKLDSAKRVNKFLSDDMPYGIIRASIITSKYRCSNKNTMLQGAKAKGVVVRRFEHDYMNFRNIWVIGVTARGPGEATWKAEERLKQLSKEKIFDKNNKVPVSRVAKFWTVASAQPVREGKHWYSVLWPRKFFIGPERLIIDKWAFWKQDLNRNLAAIDAEEKANSKSEAKKQNEAIKEQKEEKKKAPDTVVEKRDKKVIKKFKKTR